MPKRKRGLGAQGRQPSPLQQANDTREAKLIYYYRTKSQKAEESRTKTTMKDKVMESDDKQTVQGANGPLLGDMGGPPFC